MHLIGAGETERAGQYAESAAERAASKLAFGQAVRLQRVALDTSPPTPPEGRRRLRGRLGEMLEWAGFGAEAARVYLDAAEGASALQRAEFERAAAEQFLTCGRIDDGADVLHRALATAGLGPLRCRCARSVRSCSFAHGWRCSGWGSRAAADELDRLDRLRLDALFAAARGFAIVDVTRGGLHSGAVPDGGPPRGRALHVLRAALLVSTQYANAGGRRGRGSANCGPSREARRREQRRDTAFFHGRAASASSCADAGPKRSTCSTPPTASTRRAAQDGNPTEPLRGVLSALHGPAPRARRAPRPAFPGSRAAGRPVHDRQPAAVASRLLSLAADDPETARRDARTGMALLVAPQVPGPALARARTEAEVDLYLGQAEHAYATMRRDASALAKSFLLNGQFARVLTTELRGAARLRRPRPTPRPVGRLAEGRGSRGSSIAKGCRTRALRRDPARGDGRGATGRSRRDRVVARRASASRTRSRCSCTPRRPAARSAPCSQATGGATSPDEGMKPWRPRGCGRQRDSQRCSFRGSRGARRRHADESAGGAD